MIVMDEQDLLYGSSEHMKIQASRVGAILMRHRDPHTILSCIAAIVALGKEDLVAILGGADDTEGMKEFVGQSLGVTVERAKAFLDLAEGEQ